MFKFYYRFKRYENPYFKERRKKRKWLIFSFFSIWKKIFLIFFLFFLIVFVVWILIFSSFFTIKNIEVVNNNYISSSDIILMVEENINEKFLNLYLNKNILFFNKNKLIEKVKNKYFVKNINIFKKFPNTIIIKIEEPEVSIVWLENNNYFLADIFGNIITKVEKSNDIKNFLIIENRGQSKIENNKISIPEIIISALEISSTTFNVYKEFEIHNFYIDNEIETLKVSLKRGPDIYFSIKKDILTQFEKLKILINQNAEIRENFEKKSYYDLRYKDRVYYK